MESKKFQGRFEKPGEEITPLELLHAVAAEVERRQEKRLPASIFDQSLRLGHLVSTLRYKRGWTRDELASQTGLKSGERLSPVFIALLEEGLALQTEIDTQVTEALTTAFDLPTNSLDVLLDPPIAKVNHPIPIVNLISRVIHKADEYLASLGSFSEVTQPAQLGGTDLGTEELEDTNKASTGHLGTPSKTKTKILQKEFPELGVWVSVEISAQKGLELAVAGEKGRVKDWKPTIISGSEIFKGQLTADVKFAFPGIAELDAKKTYIYLKRE